MRAPPGPATKTEADRATVRVWDPVVRIFHWTVVLGVVLNYAVLDAGKTAHRYIGYVVAAAVAIRLAWGFVGSRYARFAGFVVPPRDFASHATELVQRRHRRYVGHNPAGGWMIVALLGVLSVLCVTGWMQTLDVFWGVEWIQTVHEVAANAVVAMAVVHVVAALAESAMHRENLVLAMFTGRKRPATGTDIDHARAARRG